MGTSLLLGCQRGVGSFQLGLDLGLGFYLHHTTNFLSPHQLSPGLKQWGLGLVGWFFHCSFTVLCLQQSLQWSQRREGVFLGSCSSPNLAESLGIPGYRGWTFPASLLLFPLAAKFCLVSVVVLEWGFTVPSPVIADLCLVLVQVWDLGPNPSIRRFLLLSLHQQEWIFVCILGVTEFPASHSEAEG